MYSYRYRQFILEFWLWKSGEQELFRCGIVNYTTVSTPSGFPVGQLPSQHLLSLLGSRPLAPSTYWMILPKSPIDISKSTNWTGYAGQPRLQYLKYYSLKKKLEKPLISLLRKYFQARSLKFTILFNVMNGRSPSKEPTNMALVHHHRARNHSRSLAFPISPSTIPLGVRSRVVGVSLVVGTLSHFF